MMYLGDDPRDLELTEREALVAEVAAFKNAVILRRVIVAVGAALVIAIGGSTLGWVLTREESIHRTAAINASRIQVLVQSCEDTNERNINILKQLNASITIGATPKQVQNLQNAKLLISSAFPYHPDCQGYAEDRVSP